MRSTSAALRSRVAVRDGRRVLTQLLRGAGRDGQRGVLGPVALGSCALELRAPRLADADAWRAQSRDQRVRLQPWFPAASWEQAHTDLAWAEQVVGLRIAARLGRALPHVVLLDGRLIGQLGVDAVDRGTATGELSGWSTPNALGHAVTVVGMALVCAAAFGGPAPLDRLVAPVAVGNRGPGLLLARLGFTREITLTRYRSTGSGPVDHDVWVLHRCPEVRARLAAVVVDEGTRPAALRLSAREQRDPVGVAPGPDRPVRALLVLGRLGLRLGRQLLRHRLRPPVRDWTAPLEHVLAGHRVRLRPPELADAEAGSALLRRNAARLAPLFPAPADGGTWARAQTPLHWAERTRGLRSAADRATARPRVVEVDGVLVGQCGIVAADAGTSTGELEVWLDRAAAGRFAPHALSRLCAAAVALDAFTCANPVGRLQVPLPVAPVGARQGARGVLAGIGFTCEGTLRRHRHVAGGKVDHEIWVLHGTDEVLASLRRALEAG